MFNLIYFVIFTEPVRQLDVRPATGPGLESEVLENNTETNAAELETPVAGIEPPVAKNETPVAETELPSC